MDDSASDMRPFRNDPRGVRGLAQAALAAGFTVRFSTLAAVLADLLGKESLPAFERRLRRYTSPDLLVLDELG